MTTPNFLPELSDILAAGIAAGASMAFPNLGSPNTAAMEQGVAQVAGKIAAGYFTITDVATQDNLGITEHDAFVGALRAGYSLMQKGRKNQRVATDGLKGVMCSVAGKQLAKYLKPV
jgi:hypothetical protein